jgi:hypothetical protein
LERKKTCIFDAITAKALKIEDETLKIGVYNPCMLTH